MACQNDRPSAFLRPPPPPPPPPGPPAAPPPAPPPPPPPPRPTTTTSSPETPQPTPPRRGEVLHTPISVSVSARALFSRIARGFPSGNPPKPAADRHPDPGPITLAHHIAGHDLARREHIRRGRAVAH